MTGFARFAIALPIMVALLSGKLPAQQSHGEPQLIRGGLENCVAGWRGGDVHKLQDVFARNGAVSMTSAAILARDAQQIADTWRIVDKTCVTR